MSNQDRDYPSQPNEAMIRLESNPVSMGILNFI